MYLRSFFLLSEGWVAMYFPLMTTFAASQRFWAVVLSSSLASMYFLISYLTSWLAHSFFNLQVFVTFPNFFLWLISSFIVLWSENMHGMILIFLYLGLIVSQYMVYCGECSMYTGEESIFCCFRMKCSKYICQVNLIQCVIQDHCFFIFFLPR